VAAVGGLALALWLVAGARPAHGALSKAEVRLTEVAHVLGQPGIRMRFTLANGLGVEHQTDDAREVETVLRMIEMHVSGRGRMFVELDGNSVVRAIQIAGPGRAVP
jgi:hypothetical protein